MALKTVLESLDGVQEELHDLYVEKDGKLVLDLDGFDEHPSAQAWREKLRIKERLVQENLNKVKELEAKVAILPEDFDPDEWAQIKADFEARQDDPDAKDVRKQIETATASLKQQHEANIARLKKQYETQLEDVGESLSTKDQHIRRLLVDDGLTKALIDAGVKKPSYLKGAKKLLESDVEVVEEDGQYLARMKAELGGDDIAKYVANWVQTDDGKDFVDSGRGFDPSGGNGARNPAPRKQGDMGGDRSDRVKAIASRFPDLPQAG